MPRLANRFVLVPAVLLSVTVGCAGRSSTLRLSPSQMVPAAQGTVKTAPTDDRNTAVQVRVEHLAPPDRVAPGATTYVVWARPAGQYTVQNLGALRVSNDLEGRLDTITSLQAFQLFITAEPSGAMSNPSGPELMSATVEPPWR